MEKSVGAFEFTMTFLDPGDAMKYNSWYNQLTGATFNYLKEHHQQLWADRHSHVSIKFTEARGAIVRVSLTLASGSKEVVVECKMDLAARSPKCAITTIDHSLPKGQIAITYRASIEGGQLMKLGLK